MLISVTGICKLMFNVYDWSFNISIGVVLAEVCQKGDAAITSAALCSHVTSTLYPPHRPVVLRGTSAKYSSHYS